MRGEGDTPTPGGAVDKNKKESYALYGINSLIIKQT